MEVEAACVFQSEALNPGASYHSGKETYSFTRSSCSFLGSISSICGSRSGYVSINFARSVRCTEDLTLDLPPGETLSELDHRTGI
jgi:hypothetical protein